MAGEELLDRFAGFVRDVRREAPHVFTKSADRLLAAYSAHRQRAGEVERDAARYRWLREQSSATWKRIGWNTWNDDPAVFPGRDEEIDKAMLSAAEDER